MKDDFGPTHSCGEDSDCGDYFCALHGDGTADDGDEEDDDA